MTAINQYRVRALAGTALALAGFSLGVTSSGINGKTIVAGLLWVAGLLVALRARKLIHSAR